MKDITFTTHKDGTVTLTGRLEEIIEMLDAAHDGFAAGVQKCAAERRDSTGYYLSTLASAADALSQQIIESR